MKTPPNYRRQLWLTLGIWLVFAALIYPMSIHWGNWFTLVVTALVVLHYIRNRVDPEA